MIREFLFYAQNSSLKNTLLYVPVHVVYICISICIWLSLSAAVQMVNIRLILFYLILKNYIIYLFDKIALTLKYSNWTKWTCKCLDLTDMRLNQTALSENTTLCFDVKIRNNNIYKDIMRVYSEMFKGLLIIQEKLNRKNKLWRRVRHMTGHQIQASP